MGKEITTTVVLNGRATTGFNALADKITQLGYVIDQVGGKVGDWEKESIETYKNYETYMLEAKGAMSATVSSSSELERAYAGLEKKAQEWAGTTIFHTNDVAKAISEAAHAGWDYEKMLQGIPQAMVLAQAGNTDLSTGLDMLIKTINGTGTAFEDSGEFVDQWVMAANSSATTVSELGEAMEKMGATARFGDSTEELLTMLAVLANTGTVGSAAGTLLRNSMIRLIAPTKNAREAMEDLGVEADEISDAVGGDSEALSEINEMLNQAGFSAYTTEGKLKPFLQTFKDLYKATAGMSEADRNKVLSAIFPTRTITGAMALLQAAADDYDGLLEKISGSEGYAAKVAGIQISGLMGSQELFLSKWEEFSRKIGEILSEPLESAYSIVGGFLDTLNGADPAILSAITGAATALAGAGPVLLAAGLGMKLFGALGPWGTGILAAVVGAGTLYGYLSKLNQLAMENNFGQMSLDMATIDEALTGIGEEKAGLLSNLRQFNGQFETLRENYDKAGQSLAEGLTSKMIAGTTLTETDKKKFQQYGEDMITNIKTGITTATAEKMSLASLLFSQSNTSEDSNEDLASNPAYASIISLLEIGMKEATSRAEELSNDLRSALTKGFADGKLTDEELKNIQAIMDQMNELMSGLNPSDIERNKLRMKSQKVSLESMETFSNEVNAARDAAFAGMDEELLDLQATLMAYYDWAVAHGQKFIDPVTGDPINPEEVDIQQLINNLQKQYEGKRATWEGEYDDMLMRGWENALATADTGSMFSEAMQWWDMADRGLITFADAYKRIADSQGNMGIFVQSLDTMIEFFGGTKAMSDKIKALRDAGGDENLARAEWFEMMLDIREAAGGTIDRYGEHGTNETRNGVRTMMQFMSDIYSLTSSGLIPDTEEVVAAYQSLTQAERDAWDQEIAKLKETYNLQALADEFGGEELTGRIAEWFGAYLLTYGKTKVPQEYEWGEYSGDYEGERAARQQMELYNEAMAEAQEAVAKQQERIAELQKESDKYAAEIDKHEQWLRGENLPWGYKGDEAARASKEGYEATKAGIDLDLEAAMAELATLQSELDGLSEHPPIPVDTEATLDTSAVDKWTPPAKYMHVYSVPTFAEGGRATEPSLFGEAGPEWAIPEEHSQRTASLLNAAREASGFTWGELISGSGGGTSGEASSINVNISSYAPVIHANDANGVAEELAKDKARLAEIVRRAVRSAMEDMTMKEGIEVYA